MKKIIISFLILITFSPYMSFSQTVDNNHYEYSFKKIVLIFDSRIKELEYGQEYLSQDLNQNSADLNELKTSSVEIFKKILDRLEDLSIENAELRQRLENLDTSGCSLTKE